MDRREKCRKMREAKAAKRMASATDTEIRECGRALFDGPLFGGPHTVRILSRADTPRAVYVEVDGRLTCSKTPRGARALLMRRVSAPLGPHFLTA